MGKRHFYKKMFDGFETIAVNSTQNIDPVLGVLAALLDNEHIMLTENAFASVGVEIRSIVFWAWKVIKILKMFIFLSHYRNGSLLTSFCEGFHWVCGSGGQP